MSVTDSQHAHVDALLRNFFGRIDFQTQGVAPDGQAIFELLVAIPIDQVS